MKEVTFHSNKFGIRGGTIYFSSNVFNLLSPRPMNTEEENALIEQMAKATYLECGAPCYVSRVIQLNEPGHLKILATTPHLSLMEKNISLDLRPTEDSDQVFETNERVIHNENDSLPVTTCFLNVKFHHDKDLKKRLQQFEDLLFSPDCIPKPAALASLSSTTEAYQSLFNQSILRYMQVIQAWADDIDVIYNANPMLHARRAKEIHEAKEAVRQHQETMAHDIQPIIHLAAQITYIKSELIKTLHNAAIECLSALRQSTDIAAIKATTDFFMKTFVCILDLKLNGQTSSLDEAHEKLFDLSLEDLQNFTQKLLSRCDTNRLSSTPELTILKRHLLALKNTLKNALSFDVIILERESLFWKISVRTSNLIKEHEKRIREICDSVGLTPEKYIIEFVKGFFDQHCKGDLIALQKSTHALKRSMLMKEADSYKNRINMLSTNVPHLRHQCIERCIELIKEYYRLLASLDEKIAIKNHRLTGTQLSNDLKVLKDTLKNIEPEYVKFEKHLQTFYARFAYLQNHELTPDSLTGLATITNAAYSFYIFLYDQFHLHLPGIQERLAAMQANFIERSSKGPLFFQPPSLPTEHSAHVTKRNSRQSIR